MALGLFQHLTLLPVPVFVPRGLKGEYFGLGGEFAQLPRLRVVAFMENGSAHELVCSVAPVLLTGAALAKLLRCEHHGERGGRVGIECKRGCLL